MKKVYIQFIKYVGVGGIAALVEWIIFGLIINLALLHYSYAVLLSFIIATTVNYFLSKKLVFKKCKHRLKTEALMIYLVSGLGLVLNLIFMWYFVEIQGFNTILSKIISTGIVFFWNFSARKVLVFA